MNLTRVLRVFCDVPGDGGAGGGAPAGSGSPAPSAAPAAAPAPGGGGTPGAPAAPTADDFERRFQERIARDGYLPRHRASALSSNAERLRADLEAERQRVRALAGVAPPPDPERQAVSAALLEMFPVLKTLSADGMSDRLERALKAFEDGGDIESLVQARNSVFTRSAQDAGRRATELFAKSMGKEVKDLPQGSQQRLMRGLREFILSDQTGERANRYENGDLDTLLQEFVDDVRGFYHTPFQQQQIQGAAQRVAENRGLPQQGPRAGVVPPSGPPRLDRKSVAAAARAAAMERLADA